MNILGIIDGQHDAGACIVKDGQLVAACAEERITRIKRAGGMPYHSIEEVIQLSELTYNDIDIISVGSILSPPLAARIFRKAQVLESDVLSKKKRGLLHIISDFIKYNLKLTVINPESFFGRMQVPFVKGVFRRSLPSRLKEKPIQFVNHHLSHATTAYYCSGIEEAIVITADCWGDGLSLAIHKASNGSLERIHAIKAMDSLGHFYSVITKYLGFVPFRHEGKITGLSATGDSQKVKIPFPFEFRNQSIMFNGRRGLDIDPRLKAQLDNYNREDIAAWLQDNMLNMVQDISDHWIKKSNLKRVVLAGGLFANVRFNQAIKEIPGVKEIYIFPEMGDGGLCVGGAAYTHIQNQANWKSQRLQNVYLGRAYSSSEIEVDLKSHNLNYQKLEDIESEIARLIAAGNVVARFNGKMEFGPRALGNRSILYHAKDSDVNVWLNERLNRTEFMPFAPATMFESREMCYENLEGAEFAAKFMTITFNCTDFMKDNCPAAVHVDGTARPQLVDKKDNPSFHRIIYEYHKLTGIPTIINTSFNIHEEPIVRCPEDAIRAFQMGNLDYLAIGDYLVSADLS